MPDNWRKQGEASSLPFLYPKEVPSSFAYLFHKEAAVSPDELEVLAKVASKRYVEERIPLNTTVEKLADERDLNPHQIERVCELANVATHQALWPGAKEKHKLAFELADAKKLKGKTARRRGTPAEADYAGPPARIAPSGPAVATLFGVEPGPAHEGLAGPSQRQRIVIVLSKKAAERRRVRDRLLVAAMEAETAEKRAYAAVKQEVMGEGTPMYGLLRAAAAAGLGKMAGELLPRFEEQLLTDATGAQRISLQKHAISRAPEDLISDELGATTVVNGAHPVIVNLDTVSKKKGIVQTLLYNLVRIDDEVNVLRQQLREIG